MGKIYKYNSVIDTYETTPDARMSPLAPLKFFQEIAQRQLKDLNLGFEFMAEKHLAWILVKYEIDFNKYPSAEDEIVIETEPVGFNRFEAYRRFTIYSKTGEVLVSAKSIWMLANTETGKIVRMNSVDELLKLADPENEIYRVDRLERIGEYDNESTFKVRYFDIDINHHVNNVNYLGWAIESLPVEVVREYEIKKVKIIYKDQAFFGDTVIAKNKRTGPDTWRIDVCKEDGQVLCEIEITTRKREQKLTLRNGRNQ